MLNIEKKIKLLIKSNLYCKIASDTPIYTCKYHWNSCIKSIFFNNSMKEKIKIGNFIKKAICVHSILNMIDNIR